MTFLYDARYSMVLLRPNNDLTLSTQSADKWICMGKWPVPKGGMLFLRLRKGPRRADFFSGGCVGYPNAVPDKNGARTDEGAGGAK